MNENTFSYLDQYCERAGDPGLWAEPINAISNLFFILAAALAVRVLLQAPRPSMGKSFDAWLLVLALFAIGIGSGLWHLYANADTMLMDVIPILIFMNVYLLAALKRLLGLGWGTTIFFWLLYQGLNFASETYLPRDFLNGTIMYIPTYMTLAVLTFAIWRRDHALGKGFLRILAIWTVSLFFRTVDVDICDQFALGTHFLWHALNALVLYRLLTALIAHIKKS